MTAQRRAALWSRANALRPSPPVSAPTLRGRRLARRLGGARPATPPLSLDDIAAAPEWATWPAHRRDRLARIAGAAAVAPTLAHAISGDVLLHVAQSIGAVALDAVLSLPGELPAIADRRAESGDDAALLRLGAAVLLTEVARPTLRLRLTALFDDVAPATPEAAGRLIAKAARQVMADLEPAA